MPNFRNTLICYVLLVALAIAGSVFVAVWSGSHPSTLQQQLSTNLSEVIKAALFTLGGLLAGMGVGRGGHR